MKAATSRPAAEGRGLPPERRSVSLTATSVAGSERKPEPGQRTLAQSPLFRRSLAGFHRVTGLAVKLLPAVLPERPIGFGVQEIEFCRRLTAACRGGCPMSHRTQLELLRRVERKLRPHQIRCPAGIVQLAVPVVVSGKHVATVLGGKVRLPGYGAAQFEELAPRLRRWGLEQELGPLRAAYMAAPWLTREKLRDAQQLLDLLMQLFAKAVACEPLPGPPAGPPLVAKAGEFVRQHVGEHLTTRQMAVVVHLSEAYFCRQFHRLTGLTFHAYLAQVRVDVAKGALQHSEARVNEIALATGFRSASDFSRIFKAGVGMTPSAFRGQFRRQDQENGRSNGV